MKMGHHFQWFTLFCMCIIKWTDSSATCPDGWVYIKSSQTCIKVGGRDFKTSWLGARKYCKSENADLVKIESKEKNDEIKDNLTGRDFWIGLHNSFDLDIYSWLDETKETNYTDWAPGISGLNSNMNQCVAMRDHTILWYQLEYSWNFVMCDYTNVYIMCEKTLDADSNQALCPIGWSYVQTSGTCIQLHETLKNWTDARHTCQAYGGDLVKIVNPEVNMIIAGIIEMYPGVYWIGLHDDNDDLEYSWLDETRLTNFTSWSPSFKPLVTGNGNCAIMGSAAVGKWASSACKYNQRYICEVIPDTSLNCPSNWTIHIKSETCFKFFDAVVPWFEARQKCQDEGADLVKIRDPFLNTVLLEEAMKGEARKYWIGLHDRTREGKFEWVDGKTLEYDNWYNGQPNDMEIYGQHTGQDCVQMELLRDYQWNDESCEDKASFICQSGEYKLVTTERPVIESTEESTSTGMSNATSASVTKAEEKEESETQDLSADSAPITTERPVIESTEESTSTGMSNATSASVTKAEEKEESETQDLSADSAPILGAGSLAAIVISAATILAVGLALFGWFLFRAGRKSGSEPTTYDVHFSNEGYSPSPNIALHNNRI